MSSDPLFGDSKETLATLNDLEEGKPLIG